MDEVEKQPKKRGPRPGTKRIPKDGSKIKLNHTPKTAKEDVLKRYKNVTEWGIYGLDEFTLGFINLLWKNPEITFHVTDTNESRLDNANRTFAQRSFSMYRWEVYPTSGFIEAPVVDIILCSKELYEEAKQRFNPYGVHLVLLEDV